MRDSEGARFGLLLLSKASKMPVCDQVSALIVVFRSDHPRTSLVGFRSREICFCSLVDGAEPPGDTVQHRQQENRAPGLTS